MKKIILICLSAGYLNAGIAAEPIKAKNTGKTTEQAKAKDTEKYQGEDITVYSTATTTDRKFPDTAKATPIFKIDEVDVNTKTNVATVEDFLRFAPSLYSRRRYIGDQNALIGIRGSNILQTAHTLVYADGVPLSNPVNVSFAGVPRWSQVAPGEVETAEVLYGPYSAQYGGGSIGGVINLNTKLPEKFEAELKVTGLLQDLKRGGREELLGGYNTFLSAGNRFDKVSVYGFYNHLENDGQPVDPIDVQALGRPARGSIPVTGGELTQRPTEVAGVIFGDNGTQHVITDLYKFKVGYDLTEELQARFTIAYEERDNRNNEPLSLLKNSAGNPVYRGAVNLNGRGFTVPNNAFGANILERQSLNYGLSLKGKISENWSIDTSASYFDPFKNIAIASAFSPKDIFAGNTGQGLITDTKVYWATYDGKLATDKFLGRDDLSFLAGYQFVHGSTNTKVYNTTSYTQASKDSQISDAGGQTQTNSVFSQLDWRFLPDWSVMAGVRLDHWQAIGGHNRVTATPKVQSEFADRDATRISPKAALEFTPDKWTFRYSFSRAYRFPFAEELFTASNSFISQSIPDPNLGPENGNFHNFLTKYDIPGGFIQASFFYDTIENEILSITRFNVAGTGQNINTFQALGKTETIGAELVYQQNEVFGLPVDLFATTTFTNKNITQDADFEGRRFPRIPKLQTVAALTYHILPVWNATVDVRYRSDIFQTYDNSDTAANVFNGSDEYTFVNFKTNYDLPLNSKLKSTLSVGVDNILNQDRYENNPLAQRSYYASISLKY